MLVAYTLSMPSTPSWDGNWSGKGRLWCVVRDYKDETATDIAAKRGYYYHWSDGWGANISARIVDAKEAAQLRKKSSGFCGYEWMIDSIERHRKIYADHEKPVNVDGQS